METAYIRWNPTNLFLLHSHECAAKAVCRLCNSHSTRASKVGRARVTIRGPHMAAPFIVTTYFVTASRHASRSCASSVHDTRCGSCVLSRHIFPTCSGAISQTQGPTPLPR